ncbi:MAG TPA: hypothetical protein VK826_20455 [Bacteroidia bacterium]|nr:hypothetical protein [Bacteroidia bacterium]
MLEKVVQQLDEEKFAALQESFQQNKADKFGKLLTLYRENGDEDAMRDALELSNSSFYTLKSRLQDRIQEFLFKTTQDNRAELLKLTSSVPTLIYNSPRATSIMLLLFLEQELKKHDMPAELVVVYNALKKLHLSSKKYYDYQQRYNKNVAYMLALDKADEVLLRYNIELGQYLLTGDPAHPDVLKLLLREIRNLSNLYESHRLAFIKHTCEAAYGIFVHTKHYIHDSEDSVEQVLARMQQTLSEYPGDKFYIHMQSLYHFLSFEYHHKLGLHKNSQASYEYLRGNLFELLCLSHTLPVYKFLISVAERNLQMEKPGDTLGEIFDKVYPMLEPEIETDIYFFRMYKAYSLFTRKEYSKAATEIDLLLGEVNYKKSALVEIQAKLFLALNYLLAGKTELTENVIRSLSRKFNPDEFMVKYNGSVQLLKFLKTGIANMTSGKGVKIKEEYTAFATASKDQFSTLSFLSISDEQLVAIGKL